MAKPKKGTAALPSTPAAAGKAPPPAGAPLPPPPTDLAKHITRATWPASGVIHRIHPDKYGATEFNPGPSGDARFSPIQSAAKAAIPTIYGGDTFDCAATETVFHDVPFTPGLKPVQKRQLRGHHYSEVLSHEDLTLADLSVTALRKLGVTRAQLIDTEKNYYHLTRRWAEAIHAQCPDIQGLSWVSRQDDRAGAIVLFGDRLGKGPLKPHGTSRDIVGDDQTFAHVVSLADRIGVKLHGK